jgi:hypothetical protein
MPLLTLPLPPLLPPLLSTVAPKRRVGKFGVRGDTGTGTETGNKGAETGNRLPISANRGAVEASPDSCSLLAAAVRGVDMATVEDEALLKPQ